MQDKNSSMYVRWAVLLVCVVGLGLIIALKNSSAARNDAGPTPQQDVVRLETRINQLEQRLYSIETSLRNLEQQLRLASTTSPGRQDDLTLLRSQVQALQLRLADDECALAKLDERTLTPVMREARRKSGAGNESCRLNVDAPLRLPE